MERPHFSVNSGVSLPLAGAVPAYQPPAHFPQLLREVMQAAHLARIVVTDDGSGENYQAIFREAAAVPGVTVVHHAANRGTGAALKTALQTLLESGESYSGAVTFDADGQHLPDDIAKVCRAFLLCPQKTALGVRDFHTDTRRIPWRSFIGNTLTEKVFQLFSGVHVSDTQTGLRVYPWTLVPQLAQITQDGYDFQLEALLAAARQTQLQEIPIATVYENGNATSHFHPLLDSLLISCVFLRFAASGILCSGVDYAIFCIGNFLTGQVLAPLIAARIASVSLNFYLNRNHVFRAAGNRLRQGVKFALLALFLLAASYSGITLLAKTAKCPPLAGKLLVESALFALSYLVQKRCIFHKNQ